MRSYKPRRRSGHGEIVPPLSKLDRIEELLKIQVETFPQKELTAEEIARWEHDLSNYPLPAIEFAFDEHRRMAMFFPVPGQILELCESYTPRVEKNETCPEECRSRHGKGYHWNDILWLWKKMTAGVEDAKRFANGNPKYNKALVQGRALMADPTAPIETIPAAAVPPRWDDLLDELDKWRGSAPEWRRS